MSVDRSTEETEAQFEARMLTQYRDALLRQGMARKDVDVALRVAFTEPAIKIESLQDYALASALFEALEKGVPKGEWGTPAATRLYALGGEMMRFEEEFKSEHGRLP